MEFRGVSNTVKEFSEDYQNLYNDWKYVVEQTDTGVLITLQTKENDIWKEQESMEIPFTCAIPMFREIADCLDNKIFKC